jgi:hypothetical protein
MRVDAGEDGLAVLYLRAVYGFSERFTAGFNERRAYLRRDSLELRIGHGEREAGAPEIGQSRHMRRIARRDHDREIIGHEAGALPNASRCRKMRAFSPFPVR